MAHRLPNSVRSASRLPRRLAATLAVVPLLLAVAFARARTKSDDEWQLMYFDDAKVGFVHTTKTHEEIEGKKVERRTTDSSMTINRLDTKVSVITSNWELADEKGDLLELYGESNLALPKKVQHLVRHGASATVEESVGPSVQRKTIDWNPEWLSESQSEKLVREKLGKGEKECSFSTFALESGEANVTTRLVGKEKVDVKGAGPRELLHVRIENSALPVQMDAWLDDGFETVMTSMKLMKINMTTVRSDKATCVAAFAKPDTPEMFEKISPVTNVRLPNPYQTDEVVLRVRQTDADAPMPKLEDERQTIVSKRSDRDVTLRVRRVVPTEKFTLPLSNFTAEEKACLLPSVQIEFDDPDFSKLAKEALGDEKDAWKAAQKLELFTSKYISNKNMDNLFETATGVMKSKAGDCTEHGVFLAGLCRAVGIPARVAVGFLYFQGIWGGHMWAEVSLGGKWYAIDGVLGQGSVDAGHLRLAADSLQSMEIERAFQSVAVGMTLQIDLESFRHGEHEVTIGDHFKPWSVDGRRFRSTLFGFTITAPDGFEIQPNDNISLHDNLVVELARKAGNARVDVIDVTHDFSLDQARDAIAQTGIGRAKSEARTIAGRPGLLIRGRRGDQDVLAAALLDHQELIVVTLPRTGDDDEKLFDAIVGSLAFSDAI